MKDFESPFEEDSKFIRDDKSKTRSKGSRIKVDSLPSDIIQLVVVPKSNQDLRITLKTNKALFIENSQHSQTHCERVPISAFENADVDALRSESNHSQKNKSVRLEQSSVT